MIFAKDGSTPLSTKSKPPSEAFSRNAKGSSFESEAPSAESEAPSGESEAPLADWDMVPGESEVPPPDTEGCRVGWEGGAPDTEVPPPDSGIPLAELEAELARAAAPMDPQGLLSELDASEGLETMDTSELEEIDPYRFQAMEVPYELRQEMLAAEIPRLDPQGLDTIPPPPGGIPGIRIVKEGSAPQWHGPLPPPEPDELDDLLDSPPRAELPSVGNDQVPKLPLMTPRRWVAVAWAVVGILLLIWVALRQIDEPEPSPVSASASAFPSATEPSPFAVMESSLPDKPNAPPARRNRGRAIANPVPPLQSAEPPTAEPADSSEESGLVERVGIGSLLNRNSSAEADTTQPQATAAALPSGSPPEVTSRPGRGSSPPLRTPWINPR